MLITRWISLSCVIVAVIGCGRSGAREAGNAPSAQLPKLWSSTQGVAFRPPIPSRPATQAALTTQRSRRALDEILQDISPTAEQEAAAARTLEAAQRDWVAWLQNHRPDLEQLVDQNAAAARERDRENLKQVQARAYGIVMTLPNRRVVWTQVRAVFPARRQADLEPLSTEARAAVGDALHSAVIPAIELRDPQDRITRACQICHLPYFEIKQ
jgi:hypothetical protein